MTAEDSTSLLQVEIYSYYNCFPSCNKLRPAVRLPAGLFALSNSIPYKNQYIQIEAKQVLSTHFKAKKNVVYLIKAEPSAYRYNNVSGGILALEKPHEKKFLGLTSQNSHIFSLTQHNKAMKLLQIAFPQMQGATKETFGLSAESSFTPETAYDLCLRQSNGDTLTEPEQALASSDAWLQIFRNVQRVQLNTVLPNLPFPAATIEMVAAIPQDRLNDSVEYAEAVLSGNPAEAGSISALGVEGLTEWLGAADLTAYQTPAAPEDVKAAIENAIEAPAEEVPAETTVAAEEAPAQEEVPVEETTQTENLPAPPINATTSVVVPGGKLYTAASTVVGLRDQVQANIAAQQETLQQIDKVIIAGFLNNAAELDAVAGLPATTEATETLAVEA